MDQVNASKKDRAECARCLALDSLRELNDGGAVAVRDAGRVEALRLLLSAFAISAGRLCGACLRLEGTPLLTRLRSLGALACCALALVLSACGGGGGGSSAPPACVAPSGSWDLHFDSVDCEDMDAPNTVINIDDAGDGCAVAAADFDVASCTMTQELICDGYTSTLVYTVNVAGDALEGTTTVENDAGDVCDYATTGKR